jgi:hypothetical protein
MIFACEFSSFVPSINRHIETGGDEFRMNFERVDRG